MAMLLRAFTLFSFSLFCLSNALPPHLSARSVASNVDPTPTTNLTVLNLADFFKPFNIPSFEITATMNEQPTVSVQNQKGTPNPTFFNSVNTPPGQSGSRGGNNVDGMRNPPMPVDSRYRQPQNSPGRQGGPNLGPNAMGNPGGPYMQAAPIGNARPY
ncbi:uncharacterized protein VTP21DRAFT_8382 [Calcarisporiella thermophila]|uniref:uncharacterized protein n=1 Tax=Calcarisporiella thermophila TaxID=911321 RepID=UPI003742E999